MKPNWIHRGSTGSIEVMFLCVLDFACNRCYRLCLLLSSRTHTPIADKLVWFLPKRSGTETQQHHLNLAQSCTLGPNFPLYFLHKFCPYWATNGPSLEFRVRVPYCRCARKIDTFMYSTALFVHAGECATNLMGVYFSCQLQLKWHNLGFPCKILLRQCSRYSTCG